MKKILIIVVAVVSIITYSCKKEKGTISQEVKASYPTVTYTGNLFFSLPIGGTLPNITATAYDSTIQESYPTSIDNSTFDNTTPGLYIVAIKATNKYGYIGSTYIYVAVTSVSPAIDLTGTYVRQSNLVPVNVQKEGTGLYVIDNVGGVPNSVANAPFIISAVFAQLDDTTLVFPPQPTSAGTLSCTNVKFSMAPGDTTFQYVVQNSSFGTSVRVFKKQ